MGVALNTAGVTVGYAVEASAGTRPTTNYIEIPDIKEVPEMNPEPETLETTVLKETEYKTYIEGLKDLGGAWDTLVKAYKTASESNKAVWFEIKHPRLEKSVYFTGQPSAMGLPAMAVNSVLETNLYITPTNAPAWETKSTTAEG